MRTRRARDDRDTRTREKKRFVRKPVQEKRQPDATKTSSASPKTVSSDDDEEELEIDVAKEIDAKKREEDCERATQANQKRKKKNANDVGVVSAKDGDALDPYAFENAKELFGKVDEVILIEDDDEDALDIEAEKYFENKRRKFSLTTQSMSSGQHEQVGATTTTRTSLFGKKKDEDTKKVATTTTRRDEVTPQKPSKRRVSFAKDDDYCDDGDKDDDDDDDVIIISPNSNNSNKPKTEELFDEALAEEIKSTPEKSPVIAYKRKSSPSSQSQSPIPNQQQQQQQPKKIQQKIQLLQQHHHQKMISQDPQAHLSILQEYSSNPLKKNSNLFESCLFLLKKVAGNTHYRRRLSNERPHFATTLFQSSLKIAGMSSTSKNLRLVSIALAYLFSLEIKTFSRFIDSMDISLAVAACLEESLSFHDDDDDDNDDDNNNDDEDKHKQDEDQEREQKIKEDVQTSLQALKFLPNETSACMKNIALLLAFRALQWSDTTNEEDGGDGGGEDNIINNRKGGEEKLTAEEEEQSKNNKLIKNRPMFGGDGASRQLRTRLSRSGFMKSVAKLANESSRDLVRSIHNQKNEDETKEIARQSCARLFRCARIIEAATYASSETVTTLASIDLDSWSSSSTNEDVEEKKIVLEKGSNKNDDDDAFGDPAVVCPVETTTTTTATTMEKKKKKKELVLITRVLRQNNEEEEEKEEEKVVVVERTTTTTTKSETTTTTTTTKPIDIIVNSTTPERKKKNNNDDDDSYNNNNFLLQIGSPGVLGASPIFGQMAKSPGAALDSWLEKGGDHEHHQQQQQQQRASLKKKEEGDQNTSYTKTSLNNGHKWSLARSLIQVLPTLTYLTSRSMRPTSKNLHGINAEDFLNPSIDARLALATLKACIFALTNSTNENAIGARSATQHDGLHGLVASVAFYSVMRGCILFGESAGAPPKKNVMMQGTNLDAYKDAATEMLNATMCLLVNICEANPKAKRELLKLTLDCSSFNKEEKVIMTVKKENKTEAEAETASPKVPFSTLLARIFTHAGGARKNHISIDDDDENEEITADMLETHEDEGEDLITQAYASLLLAFLVEGDADALLRAKKTLPENGIVSIVETLERFHAFHDTLDAMSASSSESLRRVVSWLRSTYSVAVASSKHSH